MTDWQIKDSIFFIFAPYILI